MIPNCELSELAGICEEHRRGRSDSRPCGVLWHAEEFSDRELLRFQLERHGTTEEVSDAVSKLIAHFGDYRGVLTAPPAELVSAGCVNKEMARSLRLIAEAAMRLVQAKVPERNIFSDYQSVVEYCHALMAHRMIEVFRVLFLDAQDGLIEDRVITEGTINHVSVYPREVLKPAIELGAVALVLVHNHPSGDPTPSTADKEITKQLVRCAAMFDVSVRDHIIIGTHGYYSMREHGLL